MTAPDARQRMCAPNNPTTCTQTHKCTRQPHAIRNAAANAWRPSRRGWEMRQQIAYWMLFCVWHQVQHVRRPVCIQTVVRMHIDTRSHSVTQTLLWWSDGRSYRTAFYVCDGIIFLCNAAKRSIICCAIRVYRLRCCHSAMLPSANTSTARASIWLNDLDGVRETAAPPQCEECIHELRAVRFSHIQNVAITNSCLAPNTEQ